MTLPDATQAPAPGAPLHFGPFVLDWAGGQLRRDGQAVDLAPKPWAVLVHLARRPGVLVSKDELLDAVWGHRFLSDSVLKVTMNSLRKALGEDARTPRWLHTVSRRGYRFGDDQAGAAPGPAPAPVAEPAAQAAPTGPATTASAQASRAAVAVAVAHGNVPAQRAPLLGRAAETAQLHAWLPSHRLITLTGPGGVGKTRLALAVAGHAAPADGVWLLRLETLADAEAVPAALARTLGLSEAAGRSVASLGRALAPLHMRWVLDNAEHVADGLAPQLAAWLEAVPGLSLLLTSQRPLRLAGEQLLPVAPLALPAPGQSPQQQAQSPAVALLLQRVVAASPQFEADEAGLAAAVAIARALDGMPLALELAAARVPLLGLTGVHERLAARLRLLTQGAADAPARHRTLRAALEWSVALLPPEAQRLLAWLSAFVAPFSVEGAQALAAHFLPDEWAALDALQTLRDMALVVDAGAPGPGQPSRLRLFESVRLLAAERLTGAGDEAAAHRAHLGWMVQRFRQSEAQVAQAGQRVWVEAFEPDAQDLSAALARGLTALPQATEAPLGESLADLAAASSPFACRAGMNRQVLLSHLSQLRAWAQQQPQGAPATQLRLDMMQVVLATSGLAGNPTEAHARAVAAWPVWQTTLARPLRIYLGYQTAMLLVRLRRQDELVDSVRQLRAQLAPDSGRYERRFVAWVEALAARNQGDLAHFRQFWAQMLAECQAAGDRAEAWTAAMGLGQASFLQGQTDEAIAVLDHAVDDLRTAGRLRAHGVVAAQAVLLRVSRDASPDTVQRLREAVQILQAEDMLWWVADALAWVPLWQGRLADARLVQDWADGLVTARGEQRGPVFSKLRQALQDQLEAAERSSPDEPRPSPDGDGVAVDVASERALDEHRALALALGRA